MADFCHPGACQSLPSKREHPPGSTPNSTAMAIHNSTGCLPPSKVLNVEAKYSVHFRHPSRIFCKSFDHLSIVVSVGFLPYSCVQPFCPGVWVIMPKVYHPKQEFGLAAGRTLEQDYLVLLTCGNGGGSGSTQNCADCSPCSALMF